MKPEMCSEYVHVCAQSVEYTSFLFGDDVQKRAKEIEDCSKISHKIQSGYGGYGHSIFYSRRGGSRSYGRGRGDRRSRGGRGGRGFNRGGGYCSTSNQPTVENPKHLPKEGRFSEQRQNLEDNEVSLQFEAGRLKYYSHEWEKIKEDSNLLDIVKDCHIELIDNIKPCQTKAPLQNIFNEKENEIIDKEIPNLLKIGAIKKAQNRKPIFLSTIFVGPQKNRELRVILNLKKVYSISTF